MSRNTRYAPLPPIAARLPACGPGARIGLIGGSFDPPHEGHAMIARTALRRLGLDHVWWLVTPGNPLKSRPLPPLQERMAACRRLVPERRMVVSGVEAGLGTRYTIDTLRMVRARLPGRRFVWVMGADNLAAFHRWRQWRDIFRLMPVAIVDRPGFRLAALASPAARTYAKCRVAEARSRSLANRQPPSWVFLTTRLSPQSSTALRAGFSR